MVTYLSVRYYHLFKYNINNFKHLFDNDDTVDTCDGYHNNRQSLTSHYNNNDRDDNNNRSGWF